MMMMKKLIPILAVAVAAGCGRSSARVRASLTDAPINIANVTHVNITVSEVRVHSDDDTNENEGEDNRSDAGTTAAMDGGMGDDHGHHEAEGDGARGKGWVMLCSTPETFDLMALREEYKGKHPLKGARVVGCLGRGTSCRGRFGGRPGPVRRARPDRAGSLR